MDEHKTMLEALAQRIAAEAGLKHSDGLPRCCRAGIRALLLGARALQAGAIGKPSRPPPPGRAGQSWNPDEDCTLLAAFDAGTPIARIAAQHERTEGAIAHRLAHIGRVEHRSTFHLYPIEARNLLEGFAQGIDPETGEVLPHDHPMCTPASVRALLFGARALEVQATRARAKPPTPWRACEPWLLPTNAKNEPARFEIQRRTSSDRVLAASTARFAHQEQ